MSEERRKPSLDDFAASAIESGGVMGNYIVVAEVVHEEGSTLSFATSDGLPPWTAKGMLMAMLEMLNFSYGGVDMDFEEPEGEDLEEG